MKEMELSGIAAQMRGEYQRLKDLADMTDEDVQATEAKRRTEIIASFKEIEYDDDGLLLPTIGHIRGKEYLSVRSNELLLSCFVAANFHDNADIFNPHLKVEIPEFAQVEEILGYLYTEENADGIMQKVADTTLQEKLGALRDYFVEVTQSGEVLVFEVDGGEFFPLTQILDEE